MRRAHDRFRWKGRKVGREGRGGRTEGKESRRGGNTNEMELMERRRKEN